jgi:hypothetical protein
LLETLNELQQPVASLRGLASYYHDLTSGL